MSSTAIIPIKLVLRLHEMQCSSYKSTQHSAQACWAANSRAVLLRAGDACNLEDGVDDTTDTFTSDETSGNGVA
jgi:hypothetical protein